MEIIRLDKIESTNSYAKHSIENFADKTVITARCQSAGRGRLERSWVDLGEGNLFMSIVLKPDEKFSEVYPNITQYLSVVLCKILETYNLKPQIKWPNDVLINGKKIAGILSETVIQGGKCKGIILGIGVNLNAQSEKLAKIPDKIATALNLEIGKEVDLSQFTDKLLDEFFKNYDEFLKTGFKYIKNDYINRNCFLNKELKVQVFNNIESGLAKSIDDCGALVLLKEGNTQTTLTIGDIL